MAKVSVVVPVYNAARYLVRCLASLTRQRLQDMEIICVDDCSSDGSREIIRSFAEKDPRVVLIRQNRNSGASACRNLGIGKACGDYIGFVDSDDYVEDDFYSVLYQRALEGYDVVKGRAIHYGEKGKIADNRNDAIKGNVWSFTNEFWSAIYRKSFLIRNRILFPADIKTFEDPVFSVKVLVAKPRLKIDDSVAYHYLYHPGSKCRKLQDVGSIESVITGIGNILKMLRCAAVSNDVIKHVYEDLCLPSFWWRMQNVGAMSKDARTGLYSSFQKVCRENLDLKEIPAAEYGFERSNMYCIELCRKKTIASIRNKIKTGGEV